MDFSQRMGYLPASKVIQSESIDTDLRNTLWNIVSECYWSRFRPGHGQFDNIAYSNFAEFSVSIYAFFFKKTVDTLPTYWDDLRKELRHFILTGTWHRVYSLLEFIAEHCPDIDNGNSRFIAYSNKALEQENSAYRFVAGKVTEITSPQEIEEIEQAIEGSYAYAGVTTHLKTSLGFLTDKQNPDYRNSIKESISAVESLAKRLVNDDKATLGQALKVLEKHHNLHPSLKTAFSALYGYTNDASGIRHSLMDNESALTQADARFMLITCSAFINFAIDSTKS
jgi:hypothetical protein